METKHTPGPWEEHGENIYNEILIGLEGKRNNSGKIAHVGFGICGYAEPEWRANAKLIAAAPELLETLLQVQKNYLEAYNRASSYILSEDDMNSIDYAINKATI